MINLIHAKNFKMIIPNFSHSTELWFIQLNITNIQCHKGISDSMHPKPNIPSPFPFFTSSHTPSILTWYTAEVNTMEIGLRWTWAQT